MINDLVSLFGKDPQDWGFRQGTIVSFDVFSGAGSVRVGGAVLTDVPFLSEAGQVSYLPGDAVLLIRFKSSWAIVGRFVSPATNAAIGRYFELAAAATGSVFGGYALTTSAVMRCTLSIPVPVWAEVATVTATLMSQARNSTASPDHLQSSVYFPATTFSVAWTSPTAPASALASQTVLAHHQLLVTPGGTLEVEGRIRSIAAGWAAHADNGSQLQATVAWNSNDG